MTDQLSTFISGFDALSPEEAEAIQRDVRLTRYEKGTVLVKEGEVAAKCYFVLEGCIRQYTVNEGIDKTTGLFMEQDAVVAHSSFTKAVPVNHYWECVEDCVLAEGTFNHELEMYNKHPKLVDITQSMIQENWERTNEELARFITSSPEVRYKHLIKSRPEVFQRVPHHHIASFIGVTPESLSRIKKRVQEKEVG